LVNQRGEGKHTLRLFPSGPSRAVDRKPGKMSILSKKGTSQAIKRGGEKNPTAGKGKGSSMNCMPKKRDFRKGHLGGRFGGKGPVCLSPIRKRYAISKVMLKKKGKEKSISSLPPPRGRETYGYDKERGTAVFYLPELDKMRLSTMKKEGEE